MPANQAGGKKGTAETESDESVAKADYFEMTDPETPETVPPTPPELVPNGNPHPYTPPAYMPQGNPHPYTPPPAFAPPQGNPHPYAPPPNGNPHPYTPPPAFAPPQGNPHPYAPPPNGNPHPYTPPPAFAPPQGNPHPYAPPPNGNPHPYTPPPAFAPPQGNPHPYTPPAAYVPPPFAAPYPVLEDGVRRSSDGWVRDSTITHLWSYNASPGVWAWVQGIGWKRLSPASESGHSHLLLLAVTAKNNGLPVDFHEDADGQIDQILV